MTAVTKTEANPAFSRPASSDRIARVVTALDANGFNTIVLNSGEEARDLALSMIPEGAEVLTALSKTLELTGIRTAINDSGRYDAIWPKMMKLDRATQGREMRKLAAAPDYVLGSVHAITEDGELLIASGSGSQIGPAAYTASKVIFVVGTQKIVRDTEEGLRRIEEYCLPLENQRMMELYGTPSVLAKILLLRREGIQGRTTVILVDENLGF